MKKVLLIVGSMREKAFNRQAALMAQKMLCLLYTSDAADD